MVKYWNNNREILKPEHGEHVVFELNVKLINFINILLLLCLKRPSRYAVAVCSISIVGMENVQYNIIPLL